MNEVVITRGLPASGKSTWAKRWVEIDPTNRVRVNRDDIRLMLYDKSKNLSFAQEEMVTHIERSMVKQAITEGKSIVIDAMHLRPKYIREWYKVLKGETNYSVVTYEFEEPLSTLHRRDADREEYKRVGSEVIDKIWSKFTKNGTFLPVESFEEFRAKQQEDASEPEPYVPDESNPKTILVDVDGTVAKNLSGRGWFDWSRVGEDSPVENVLSIVRGLQRAGFLIIFISGRSDACSEDTHAWLATHLGTRKFALVMRSDDDNRPDYITKLELFNEVIRPYFNIIGVIDDRPSVNRMWRKLGLTTLQVGDPHVEF